METDSIFWIASMSKPILGTLLLMLQDEGLLSVDDPVEKYLPEFKNLKTPDGKPANVTDPGHFCSRTPRAMGEIKPAQARASKTLADVIPLYVAIARRLYAGNAMALLPVGHQHGGRIAEVVTGKPLEKLLEEAPLWPAGHEGHDVLSDRKATARAWRRHISAPRRGS